VAGEAERILQRIGGRCALHYMREIEDGEGDHGARFITMVTLLSSLQGLTRQSIP
jgi:hypothetical protein